MDAQVEYERAWSDRGHSIPFSVFPTVFPAVFYANKLFLIWSTLCKDITRKIRKIVTDLPVTLSPRNILRDH